MTDMILDKYSGLLPASGGTWDLLTAIGNGRKYAEAIGGVGIGLLGMCLLLAGLWHFFKKMNSTQPGGGNAMSTGKLVGMLVSGGAMISGGGWLLYKSIAQGGKKTIEDAGNGFVLLDQAGNLVHLMGLFS